VCNFFTKQACKPHKIVVEKNIKKPSISGFKACEIKGFMGLRITGLEPVVKAPRAA